MKLQDLVNEHINGFSKTNNFQVKGTEFSNESIIIANSNPPLPFKYPGFTYASFKNVSLINIKFIDANFTSSYFKECVLEDCIFNNIDFTSVEFEQCDLKNCLFINCEFQDSDFRNITFNKCQFQITDQGKGNSSFAFFESCHFIEPVFHGYEKSMSLRISLIDLQLSNADRTVKFTNDLKLNDLLDYINNQVS